MLKTSDKRNAQYIAGILKHHNCTDVVIAPGSRNAPLIMAFTADNDYSCISVPDERSAAFTALGMALGKQQPVAVICSSGSATVNFYPAVVEAFYQRLPLVIITADRPLEWIDQGIGQSIRQDNIFEKHIEKSVSLNRNPQDDLSRNYNQRLINEAMLASKKGPVHINIPFDEPLYQSVEVGENNCRVIQSYTVEKHLSGMAKTQYANIWNKSSKVMLLIGQMQPNEELQKVISALYEKRPFLILTETVSNFNEACSIACIDRLITPFSEDEKKAFSPDILITIGGEIISKRIKKILKDYSPSQHWHIDESGVVKDTFHALTDCIALSPIQFFRDIASVVKTESDKYVKDYLTLDKQRQMDHDQYSAKAPFSDFKVFEIVFKNLPQHTIVHYANSAGVRYAQLFDHSNGIMHYANRGTSGIDGCNSTAVGHAMMTTKMLTLITGDIAFLYDSNAFWNDNIPSNLRVIIINNNGGNIFRIIEGPSDEKRFERFQETQHQYNAKGIAQTFDINYNIVETEKGLVDLLPEFYKNNGKASILEIKTPRIESPEVLKNYFKYLNNG